MTIAILHGVGSYAGQHWMGWLKKSLTNKHTVIIPEFPRAEDPDRSEWLTTLQSNLNGTKPKEILLVGHSLGVPTALDYIESSPSPVKALVSVSGFHADYAASINNSFMSAKPLNMLKVKNNLKEAHVIFGDNDPYVPQGMLHALAEALSVAPIVVEDGGHLNTESGFTEFPLVLEIIQKIKT